MFPTWISKTLPGFVAENQDVLDIEGAADHMVLHLMEVHNLDQVEVEDLLAKQKEVLDVAVIFDDEDDKGMAAVVDDRKEVLSEVLPRNKSQYIFIAETNYHFAALYDKLSKWFLTLGV